MAIEISDGSGTPHATDYADLLDKLVTFATANGWTELENTSDKVVLSGEGSGSDEIIVAFQKYSDVPTDAFGWFINGYTGWTDGLNFTQQPGALPNWVSTTQACYPAMPLWNSTIPYWFIVNDRRIIVVAKVSTTYQMCYAGFFLPFYSPGQYPYPLMIGGSQTKSAVGTIPRFSVATSAASMFWSGRDSGPSSLNIRGVDGVWHIDSNSLSAGSNSSSRSSVTQSGIHPYNNTTCPSVTTQEGTLDGEAVLTPLMWSTDNSTGGFRGNYGEIDGVFHVSGNSHAAEDIITIDGDDYLVVQDVFRTAVENYCAVKLV